MLKNLNFVWQYITSSTLDWGKLQIARAGLSNEKRLFVIYENKLSTQTVTAKTEQKTHKEQIQVG